MLKNTKYETFFYYWIASLILLLSLMIIVGGLTRLTDSGLSITQWQLFSGILPPLNVKKNEVEQALKIIKKVCSELN